MVPAFLWNEEYDEIRKKLVVRGIAVGGLIPRRGVYEATAGHRWSNANFCCFAEAGVAFR